MKSKLIIPSLVAAAVIGGATLATATSASADPGSHTQSTAQQTQRSQERASRMQERLNSAVAEGTLTTEQKASLEARLTAMYDERQALHDSDATRGEMRAAMDETRDELKAWAKEHNIHLQSILPAFQHRGGHGQHAVMDKE